jgi:hypothetical protein
MAMNAMLAMAITTAESRATMNHAARFWLSGGGWVIPMVLMKAFEMSSRRFMFSDQKAQFMVAGNDVRGDFGGESERMGTHLLL